MGTGDWKWIVAVDNRQITGGDSQKQVIVVVKWAVLIKDGQRRLTMSDYRSEITVAVKHKW